MVTSGFWRNTLFFTFALMMPGRVERARAEAARQRARRWSDIAPVGAEPVVPRAALPDGGGGDD